MPDIGTGFKNVLLSRPQFFILLFVALMGLYYAVSPGIFLTLPSEESTTKMKSIVHGGVFGTVLIVVMILTIVTKPNILRNAVQSV